MENIIALENQLPDELLHIPKIYNELQQTNTNSNKTKQTTNKIPESVKMDMFFRCVPPEPEGSHCYISGNQRMNCNSLMSNQPSATVGKPESVGRISAVVTQEPISNRLLENSQASRQLLGSPLQHRRRQQQAKQTNVLSLFDLGQQTVEDILEKSREIFALLNSLSTTSTVEGKTEKKRRIERLTKTVQVLFRRLRMFYHEANNSCQSQGMQYVEVDSLIPWKDESNVKYTDRKDSQAYKILCAEKEELSEKVSQANLQIKEVIDHMRRIVYDVNVMLEMRKS